jgi:putative SOS response-associated peptidase YedK
MCTRFVLEQDRLRALLATFDPAALAALASAQPAASSGTAATDRFNIAPGTPLLALRAAASPPFSADARPASFFRPRWGLIPAWSRDATRPPVNARAETVAERPTFRDAFRRRRCLIPASGFYEWEERGRARHPWLFRRRDGHAFFFAGLWETWTAPDSDRAPLETCAFVTTAPNATVAPIHDRMPALLDAETARLWLDPDAPPDALASLLRPAADDLLDATELIRRINHLEHDDPACLTPAREAPPDAQFTLGF